MLKWGVPGFTPGNPISTLPFEKVSFSEAQTTFQLRLSCVSVVFQLRFSFVSDSFQTLEIRFSCGALFCDPKISAFLKVKLLVKLLVLVFNFSCVSAGKNHDVSARGCSPSATFRAQRTRCALFLRHFLSKQIFFRIQHEC